jgi:hypothetical protein
LDNRLVITHVFRFYLGNFGATPWSSWKEKNEDSLKEVPSSFGQKNGIPW